MEATSVLSQVIEIPRTMQWHMSNTAQRIHVALASLVDLESFEGIENVLKSHEISGVRGCCTHCVLAKYLMRLVPELVWVEVDTTAREIQCAIVIQGRTEGFTTVLPSFLGGFVDAFDLDHFPDLVGDQCNCAVFDEIS